MRETQPSTAEWARTLGYGGPVGVGLDAVAQVGVGEYVEAREGHALGLEDLRDSVAEAALWPVGHALHEDYHFVSRHVLGDLCVRTGPPYTRTSPRERVGGRAVNLRMDVIPIVAGIGLGLGLKVVVHAERTGGLPQKCGARKHTSTQGCLAYKQHRSRPFWSLSPLAGGGTAGTATIFSLTLRSVHATRHNTTRGPGEPSSQQKRVARSPLIRR